MGDMTMDVVGSCVFGVAFNTQVGGFTHLLRSLLSSHSDLRWSFTSLPSTLPPIAGTVLGVQENDLETLLPSSRDMPYTGRQLVEACREVFLMVSIS
jgi:hypothetical protein